jgi:hypothetical protein
MAVKTTLEQLEKVQAAIREVMTSQELSGPESRIVRARLGTVSVGDLDLKGITFCRQGDWDHDGETHNPVVIVCGEDESGPRSLMITASPPTSLMGRKDQPGCPVFLRPLFRSARNDPATK